jgi:phospholipid transport system substrate-binding protein
MIRKVRSRCRSHSLRWRPARAAAAVFVLLLAAPAAESAISAESADAFVSILGDTAIRELAPDDITPAQREAKFRELLRANFDLQRITRFVLGRYARRISEDEMEKFRGLYEEMAILTYAQMFASYQGHVFKVTKKLGGSDDKYIMVVSELSEADGTLAARLDWQVLADSGAFAVVDIRVEGVSMAIAQRDEFTAFLDKNGGDMDALLEELAGKVRKLRDKRDKKK